MSDFVVEIVEANKLNDRLMFGNIQPYIKIKVESVKNSTKVVYKQTSPKFYQKFHYDSNKFTKDTKIYLKICDLVGKTGITSKPLGKLEIPIGKEELSGKVIDKV
jgi:hypothetical protein